MVFLPPYSSCMNTVERIWSQFKVTFSKYLSKITVKFNHDKFEASIEAILDMVKAKLRPEILNCAQKYYDLSEAGELI